MIAHQQLSVPHIFSCVFGERAQLRFRYTDVYVHLAPVAKVLRKNKAFIGYAVAIVAHNGLLALAFIQYHQRIWWYDSLEP